MSIRIEEQARQHTLDTYRIVDSLPEGAYDDIVKLAATICEVPIALVSLVDRDRQWFKARLGLDQTGTRRDIAFCDHAIREPEQLMEVRDAAQDPRFAGNPLVTGDPGIRFYASMPLLTPSGTAIGTVCVIDRAPRELSAAQRESLSALARVTMNLLDARRIEHDHRVADVLAQAESVVPATTGAPTASRTVGLFELQEFSAAVARLGGRAVERLLVQLEESLDAMVDHAGGDSLSRVTGSGELVAVLHGNSAGSVLQSLMDRASALGREHGLALLTASANACDDTESLQDVFARADAALSRTKDADAGR